ncbi:MAG: hypothetical protein AB7G51_01510 [Steroidobacteraceae bacterium]
MKGIIVAATSWASLACLTLSGAALAQDKPPESYIYATYFKCDVTLQERADEIVAQLDKPLWDAAIADGSVAGWGWLVHHTGGQWRRVQYFRAGSIDALFAAQKKVGDQADAKNKKLVTEFGKICNSHDDYIWRTVAGSGNERARGGASFSVYYTCDQAREAEADALVKDVFAPMYDRMVADGSLKSWGWNEHVVGAQYRRLATMTAADVGSLMKARAAVVAAMEKNPLVHAFDTLCGSHADYIWEIKSEVP